MNLYFIQFLTTQTIILFIFLIVSIYYFAHILTFYYNSLLSIMDDLRLYAQILFFLKYVISYIKGKFISYSLLIY